MIKIKVIHLRPKKKNDFAESVTIDSLNVVADDFAKRIKKGLKGAKCDECKNKNSTLIIKADRLKTIKVIKSGFCCKNFADSIKINIKH